MDPIPKFNEKNLLSTNSRVLILNMAIVSQKYSQKKYKIQIRHFDPTFKDFCLSFKILHMEKFKSADYKYNNIFSKLKQN